MEDNVTNQETGKTFAAIIPTLNPGSQIVALLDKLVAQSLPPTEIIVVDSQSDDGTPTVVNRYIDSHSDQKIRFIGIERKTFDHGATRDMVLRQSIGDFVLFLTQDAMPADEHYIENLMKPFSDEKVALVTGRQIARSDARPAERLVRELNYPKRSHVRDVSDIERLGIKAFFASDVCAAYRRSAYLAVGGFEHPIDTNEDMLIAAAFLHAGYKIAYEASAKVIHSHNFTLKQQYRRNYLMGKEIQKHEALLGGAKVAGEGMSLVKYVIRGLAKGHHFGEIVRFCFDCAARLLGNRAGAAAGAKLQTNNS